MSKLYRRIEELDIIKGILIIFIIFRHILPMSGLSQYGPNILNVFQIFSESILVVFMLISGYCYSQKESIWIDIKYRYKTIIIPTLKTISLITIIYFIKYIMIDGQDIMLWLNNVLCNYLGIAGYNLFLKQYDGNILQYSTVPFWYLYQLFSAYTVFIPIYKYLKDKTVKMKLLAVVLLLATSMLLYQLDIQGSIVDLFSSPWSYYMILINIIGFAGVLLLGTILKQVNIFGIIKPPLKWIIFVVSSIFYLYLCIIYETRYGFQYGKWGPYGMWSIPLTTLAGSCLLYCLFIIASYLKKIKIVKNIFAFIGSNSLYFLLLHFIICEIVAWIFGYWYNIYYLNGYPKELYAPWHGIIESIIVYGLITLIVIIIKRNKKV